jgi:hypothetical protein
MAKRRSITTLPDHQIEAFTVQAVAMHRLLAGHMMGLRTGSDHYRALNDFHATLCKAVERITGKAPPWADGHGTIRVSKSPADADE